jgi:hypothetical protein
VLTLHAFIDASDGVEPYLAPVQELVAVLGSPDAPSPEVGPELGEMRPCVEEDVNTEDEGWCSQPIHFPLHDFSMCRRQQAERSPEPSVLGKTTFVGVVFTEGAELRRDGNDFP